MMLTRRVFLHAFTAAGMTRPMLAATSQLPRAIVISCDPPDSLGDYGRGVRLGVQEAERAAVLLGHRFELVHRGPAVASIAMQARPSAIPLVAMHGASDAACTFVTASTEADSIGARAKTGAAQVVDWHTAFRRYGASELNERYEKAFARPMTADAWHGWVAVKAITEAAIRGADVCAELARLRFDGHKGRALSFDPVTRRLRHPMLAVSRVGDLDVVEVLP
jgi:hypothetical protein